MPDPVAVDQLGPVEEVVDRQRHLHCGPPWFAAGVNVVRSPDGWSPPPGGGQAPLRGTVVGGTTETVRGHRGAVAYCVRADARRSWPAWLALGVLVGLAAGSVMAAAAGARRTESAYQDLRRETAAMDGAIAFECNPASRRRPARRASRRSGRCPASGTRRGSTPRSSRSSTSDGRLVQVERRPLRQRERGDRRDHTGGRGLRDDDPGHPDRRGSGRRPHPGRRGGR